MSHWGERELTKILLQGSISSHTQHLLSVKDKQTEGIRHLRRFMYQQPIHSFPLSTTQSCYSSYVI